MKIFVSVLIFILMVSFATAGLQILGTDTEQTIDLIRPTTTTTSSINLTNATVNYSLYADLWLTDQGQMDNVPDLYTTLDTRYLQTANFYDTNASTACGVDEFLDGDGDCVAASSLGNLTWNQTLADSKYLKLDASNDPVTANLEIDYQAGNSDPFLTIQDNNQDRLIIDNWVGVYPRIYTPSYLYIQTGSTGASYTIFKSSLFQMESGASTAEFASYSKPFQITTRGSGGNITLEPSQTKAVTYDTKGRTTMHGNASLYGTVHIRNDAVDGFLVEDDAGNTLLYADTENLRVGIGGAADTKFEVNTGSTWGSQSVTIDQDDSDKAFVDFQGTSSSGSTANNICTGSATTCQLTASGFVRVEVNGVTKWVQYWEAIPP